MASEQGRGAGLGGPTEARGSRLKRGLQAAFATVLLLVCALPLAGMAFASTQETSENRELAALPQITEEDGFFNVAFLSDLGAYFEDHFAFRNLMVSLNAQIRMGLFGTSPTDQVVAGRYGWLFYEGTLDDYFGRNPMTERELRSAAHNLRLMQAYVESQGACFLFTLAPNKNSLYGDSMPENYLAGESAHNAERLEPYLVEYGVNYVNLFDAMTQVDPSLGQGADAASSAQDGAEGAPASYSTPAYLKTDSHWNNRGALAGANALLAAAAADALEVSEEDWVGREDLLGDLLSMVDPLARGTEWEEYAAGYNDGEGLQGSNWRYVTDVADVTESWIETEASEDAPVVAGEGSSLLCFRDSFGNALVPYLASAFDKTAFSKLVPYNADKAIEVGATTVIVERAERHLSYLAETAPIAPCPQVAPARITGAQAVDDEGFATCSVSTDGRYTVFQGTVDARYVRDDTLMYVQVIGADGAATVYEAYLIATDDNGGCGYFAYIPSSALDASVAEVVIAAVSKEVSAFSEVSIDAS